MIKNDSRHQDWKRPALGLTLGLLIVMAFFRGYGRFLSQKIPASEASREFVEQDLKTSPPREERLGTVRLVVDQTISMAGFVSPDGYSVSRFNRSLQQVAVLLPGHQLYSFGLRSGAHDASLNDLLVYQPHGLGRFFEAASNFKGKQNQDHLLFRALAKEDERSPLVLVTDGVFSTSDAMGLSPVVKALNALLDNGWSLGILALRGEFYGVPCESLTMDTCTGRWFFSEAASVQGRPSLIKLGCEEPFERNYYVVVLSPTADFFKTLAQALVDEGRGDFAILLAHEPESHLRRPTLDLSSVEYYDVESEWPWMMIHTADVLSPLTVSLDLPLASNLPVAEFGWAVNSRHRTLEDDDAWKPISTAGRLRAEITADSAQHALGTEHFERGDSLIGRETCRSRLEALYESGLTFLAELGQDASALGSKASLLALCGYQRFHCASLAASRDQLDTLPGRDADLAPFFVLASTEALRRHRLEEHAYYLELAASGADRSLAGLIDDLRGLTPVSALSSAVVVDASSSAPTGSGSAGATPSAQILLELDWKKMPSGALLYRVGFEPRVLKLSPEVYERSTVDDSAPHQFHRTFRFAELVGALTTAHLERLTSQGQEPAFYLTVIRP